MARMGRPVTGRNTDRVTMSIDKRVLAQTKHLAKANGVTLSKYVTGVLLKHIEAVGQN